MIAGSLSLRPAEGQETAMQDFSYQVLLADVNGRTHFEDRSTELNPTVYVPGIPLVDVASPIPVTTLAVSCCEANYVSDWHPAPRRQFVFVLEGGLDVTPGAGDTRRFSAGSMFVVEDVAGEGHQTRTVGQDQCVFVTVACE
jgi:hypothetical protein